MSIDFRDVPPDVQQQTRANAPKEWPDDFVMQAHTVGQQAEAFRRILAVSAPDVADAVRLQISARATGEWPKDYVMQLHTLEQQLSAYRQLHGI